MHKDSDTLSKNSGILIRKGSEAKAKSKRRNRNEVRFAADGKESEQDRHGSRYKIKRLSNNSGSSYDSKIFGSEPDVS